MIWHSFVDKYTLQHDKHTSSVIRIQLIRIIQQTPLFTVHAIEEYSPGHHAIGTSIVIVPRCVYGTACEVFDGDMSLIVDDLARYTEQKEVRRSIHP